MAASDCIHAPMLAAASTANNSSSSKSKSKNGNNERTVNATTALNVHALQLHRDEEHARAVARKTDRLNEPQSETHAVARCRRRKRDVFFAFFAHSSRHSTIGLAARVAADTASTSASAAVQIPCAYTNPEHKGCVVSGRRVAYSRHMHQGRKAVLVKKLECAVPEDTQVLDFPATLLQLEEAREEAEREAARNRQSVAKSYFF